jgi:hypothetical protein
VPAIAANPDVAALRLGERLRAADALRDAAVLEPELATPALPSSLASVSPQRPPAGLAPGLILLAALGLGALMIIVSATPDAVLARGRRGNAIARARVEVALAGAGIVGIVALVYVLGNSS